MLVEGCRGGAGAFICHRWHLVLGNVDPSHCLHAVIPVRDLRRQEDGGQQIRAASATKKQYVLNIYPPPLPPAMVLHCTSPPPPCHGTTLYLPPYLAQWLRESDFPKFPKHTLCSEGLWPAGLERDSDIFGGGRMKVTGGRGEGEVGEGGPLEAYCSTR